MIEELLLVYFGAVRSFIEDWDMALDKIIGALVKIDTSVSV